MATCRSVTIAGTRCTKSCVPGSSYCPYHQDRSAVLLLVVGVLLTAVVTYVGIRYADSCRLFAHDIVGDKFKFISFKRIEGNVFTIV